MKQFLHIATLLLLLSMFACGDASFEQSFEEEEGGAVASDVEVRLTSAKGDNVGSSPNDIKGHYLRQEMLSLAEEGIMNGYPDGTFRPNAPLTRAAYAALLSNAFSQEMMPAPSGQQFSDVPTGHWAAEAISKVNEAGFMVGFKGRFSPNDSLTREQALVALAGGLNLPKVDESAAQELFRDANDISSWAKEGISAVAFAGITGNPAQHGGGKFLSPKRVMTRADAAAYIFYAKSLTRDLKPIISEKSKVEAGSSRNVKSGTPVLACVDGVIYGSYATFASFGLATMWTAAVIEPTPAGEAAAVVASVPVSAYIGGTVGLAVANWRGCFGPLLAMSRRLARAGYSGIAQGVRSLASSRANERTCNDRVHRNLENYKSRVCFANTACTEADSCEMLHLKARRNSQCANARLQVMNRCFNGGDDGHRARYNGNINAYNQCIRLMTRRNSPCRRGRR